MPTAETQADYEDFPVAEMEAQQEIMDQDVEEDSSDDESRFDAAGAVSLIYKVEMEDKKGTDLPILRLNFEISRNSAQPYYFTYWLWHAISGLLRYYYVTWTS